MSVQRTTDFFRSRQAKQWLRYASIISLLSLLGFVAIGHSNENERGSDAGGNSNSTNSSIQPNYVVIDIGEVRVDQWSIDTPVDVASNGNVLFKGKSTVSDNIPHRVWSLGSGMQDLPLPSGTLLKCYAVDMNDSGEIIGTIQARYDREIITSGANVSTYTSTFQFTRKYPIIWTQTQGNYGVKDLPWTETVPLSTYTTLECESGPGRESYAHTVDAHKQGAPPSSIHDNNHILLVTTQDITYLSTVNKPKENPCEGSETEFNFSVNYPMPIIGYGTQQENSGITAIIEPQYEIETHATPAIIENYYEIKGPLDLHDISAYSTPKFSEIFEYTASSSNYIAIKKETVLENGETQTTYELKTYDLTNVYTPNQQIIEVNNDAVAILKDGSIVETSSVPIQTVTLSDTTPSQLLINSDDNGLHTIIEKSGGNIWIRNRQTDTASNVVEPAHQFGFTEYSMKDLVPQGSDPANPKWSDFMLTGLANNGMICGNALNEAGEWRAVLLLKMDLDVNNDGDVTDTVDGLKNYLPGYEGGVGKLHSGTTFETVSYSGAQAVRLVLGTEIQGAKFKIKDGVTDYEGYCVNGFDQDLYNSNDEDFSFDDSTNKREIDATVANGETSAILYCKDYGAACTIEVIVDGTTLFEVQVPQDTDKDDDQLADAWQVQQIVEWNAQYNASLDTSIANLKTTWPSDGDKDREEEDPDENGSLHPHKTKGDGLDFIKEYRGYITDFGPNHTGGHKRLSAAKKELLVEVSEMTGIQTAINSGINSGISFNLQSIQNAVTDFYADRIGIDCYWVKDEIKLTGYWHSEGIIDYDADGSINQPGERNFAYIWDTQTINGEVVRQDPADFPNTPRIGGGAYLTDDSKLKKNRGQIYEEYFELQGFDKQIPLNLERELLLSDFVQLVLISRWGRVRTSEPLSQVTPTTIPFCLVPKSENNESSFDGVNYYEGSLCSVVGTAEEGDVIVSGNGTHYSQAEFGNVFEWVVAHEIGHLFNSRSNHSGAGGLLSSSSPGTAGLNSVPNSSVSESNTYDFSEKASVLEINF